MNGYIPYTLWGADGKEYIANYLAHTGGNVRIGKHTGTVAYIGKYGISVNWN